jgi:FkbM family methyltransferase
MRRSLMNRLFQEFHGKWRYLTNHAGFRQAPLMTLSRLFRWRLHCAFGIPATVSIPPFGVRMSLSPQWRGGGSTVIFAVRGQYELELAQLRRFVSPGKIVVDGGASCGIYALAAARLAGPSAQVFAFEPCSETFSILERNIDLNHLSNVRAYRMALSDKNSDARLYHHRHGPNSYSLAPPADQVVGSEEVASCTLDDTLRKERIDQVGLIKLDVEGAEELALRGAAQVIARSRPTIIFESHAAAARHLGLTSSGPWDLLKAWGYRFFFLAQSGVLHETSHRDSTHEITNVVAIHRGEVD